MTTTQRRSFNDGITKSFNVIAKGYDSERVQHWVYRPTQDDLIAVLGEHRPKRVLDVGCGTGILADRIQRELRPEQVTGVDLSEGMLANAKSRSDKVTWLRAPAETLPLTDSSADAVTSTWAFHFFNQPAALAEFHRVLAPGGVVALGTAIQPFPLPDVIRERTLRWLSPAHHPSAKELRNMLAHAGFDLVSQEKVRRPLATRWLSDMITVGVKA